MNRTKEALTLISAYHSDCIQMVKAIAGNLPRIRRDAEDFVQDMYIRLAKYPDLYEKVIDDKGRVRKGYLFFTLRSIVINDIKLKKNNIYKNFTDGNHSEVDFDEVIPSEGRSEYDIQLEELESKMYDVVKDNLHWFDAMLFEKYLKGGLTFKQLSKETGLGTQTIYRTMKKAKLKIAEEMLEDYKRFINNYKTK
jgi:RNA polymerase sigma factor (sigma-70 family)